MPGCHSSKWPGLGVVALSLGIPVGSFPLIFTWQNVAHEKRAWLAVDSLVSVSTDMLHVVVLCTHVVFCCRCLLCECLQILLFSVYSEAWSSEYISWSNAKCEGRMSFAQQCQSPMVAH